MNKSCFARAAFLALACLSAVDPAWAAPPGGETADVFGSGKLWTFHLSLSAKDWEAMQPTGGPRFGRGFGQPPAPAAPAPQKPAVPADRRRSAFGVEFPYVKGTLEADGQTYRDVGVRFKGNSSYMMGARGLKRPFKIDFNRHIEGQTFHGLTMINLSNNAMDPSQLREALAYAIFRDAGVPAPRTAFVKMYLTVPGKHDRVFLGLYTLIEQVNGTFLKEHFRSSKGLLLKPERARGLPYLGEDWSAYESRYGPKRNAGRTATRRLIEFTKLVQNADDAAVRKEIGRFMDVDEFLRYLAVNVALANFDSFLGLGHNFYLYLRPDTNQFVWIPWDLNLSFGALMMGGSPEQAMDLSIAKPTMGPNRLIDRMLAVKEFDALYRGHLRTLATKVMKSDRIQGELDAMQKAVQAVLDEEAKSAPKPPAGPPGRPGGMFDRGPNLKTFVTRRVESLTAQLDGKSQGQVLRGRGPGGFGPGMFLAGPILRAADTNGDKKISHDEFVAAARRLFEACDRDHKGSLDEKALADGLNRLLPAPPRPPGFAPPGRPGGR